MTFEMYMLVKAVMVSIGILLTAVVSGLTGAREKSLRAHAKMLKGRLEQLKPKDRLPSKREKRKMKWARREIAGLEEESKLLKKKHLVVVAIQIIMLIWLLILTASFAGAYFAMWWFTVLITMTIIENTLSKSWNFSTVLGILFWITAGFLMTYVEVSQEANLATEYVPVHDTVTYNVPANPNWDPGRNEEDPMPERRWELEPNEPNERDIVGEILYDREDAIYYEHLPELERYTDEFGVDLDRLLGDYGYNFFLYDPEEDGISGFSSMEEPESSYYWVVFTRDGSKFNDNIAIHSYGGWIRCVDGDDTSYTMVPLAFEEPDVTVSLHEKEYLITRDVLALLMEYLDTRPKVERTAPVEMVEEFRV
ncbi:hypothetical protein IJJ37_02205 [Candidatus Saccharibacteria bacterium]|nr:hypothetical protein [Candidatus Saccharibacteria bacterium]